MSVSIPQFGQVEKLVNSLVLGTSVARLVGSSPTLPTRSDTIDTNVSIGKSIDTMSDTIATGMIRSRKKGVLVVQGFKTYVSLRNYHHTFFLSQVGNTIVITYLFLKNLSLHLCDGFVSNRIKKQRINHKCNKK